MQKSEGRKIFATPADWEFQMYIHIYCILFIRQTKVAYIMVWYGLSFRP